MNHEHLWQKVGETAMDGDLLECECGAHALAPPRIDNRRPRRHDGSVRDAQAADDEASMRERGWR